MVSEEIVRPHFYYHQYVGPEDLTAEQVYQRDMRRRHSLGPHTHGIVSGLDLVEQPAADGSGGVDVIVRPGAAIDGFGREIIALRPYKLERALFADCPGTQHREVWIAYDETRAQTRIDRTPSCDPADRYGRVHETFRIIVGPQTITHDPILIAGRAVAPLDGPGGRGAPAAGAPAVPPDESVPYQAFSSDVTSTRWLVRLGSVKWDATFVNWDGSKGRFLPADPGRLLEQRRYVGNITAEVLAPAGQLRIKDRTARHPLPDDPKDLSYGGVAVQLDGSLQVARLLSAKQDAYIDGKVGIGTSTLKGRLTISGIAQPQQGTITLFSQDAGFVYDGGSNGVFIFKDTGGKTAFVDGKVGIGTVDPHSRLQVKTLTAIDEGSTAAGAWANFGSNAFFDGAWKRVDAAKAGVSLHMNADGEGQEFRFLKVEADGSQRNIAVLGTQTSFIREGDVGIGTIAPTNRFHVNGATGVRQNRLYLSGGDSWSSLTYNAYHNATNSDWVFPDPTRPAVTIEMDDIEGHARFDVWSTRSSDKTRWIRRLHIDGNTGDVFFNEKKLVPVFRLSKDRTLKNEQNKNELVTTHFYTSDPGEIAGAIAQKYKNDGVRFYAFV